VQNTATTLAKFSLLAIHSHETRPNHVTNFDQTRACGPTKCCTATFIVVLWFNLDNSKYYFTL